MSQWLTCSPIELSSDCAWTAVLVPPRANVAEVCLLGCVERPERQWWLLVVQLANQCRGRCRSNELQFGAGEDWGGAWGDWKLCRKGFAKNSIVKSLYKQFSLISSYKSLLLISTWNSRPRNHFLLFPVSEQRCFRRIGRVSSQLSGFSLSRSWGRGRRGSLPRLRKGFLSKIFFLFMTLKKIDGYWWCWAGV